MTSQLKLDKLQGRTTAGSIVVTSEGTAVETNLQQGLLKVWHNFDGESTVATRDSFNVSGITDVGTGDYRSNLTNYFANDDYAHVLSCSSQNGYTAEIEREAYNTTSALSHYVMDFVNGGVDDANVVCALAGGDLA